MFEHRVTTLQLGRLHTFSDPSVHDALALASVGGWELVQVLRERHPGGVTYEFYWKRPSGLASLPEPDGSGE